MVGDQDLWAAVAAADMRLAKARADFYQHAKARREGLAAALRGSNWDRGAALSLLEVLPVDVPELLDELVEHAMSQRWALAARRAIAAGRREEVAPLLSQIVNRRLASADAEDYRRLAELFRHLGDDESLAALIHEARSHPNPDIREVGEDFG